MALVLIEAPGKVDTVRRNFPGPGKIDVIATYGHLFDLPQFNLGIEADRIQLVPINMKTLHSIREAAEKHSEIYVATDPDREGEVIARQVMEILVTVMGKKNVVRIHPHDLSRQEFERAIAAGNTFNEGLARAGMCRRVVDRLIGFLLSRRAGKDLGANVSIGRVKTAILQQAVNGFIGKSYYGKLVFALGYDGVLLCNVTMKGEVWHKGGHEGWFRIRSIKSTKVHTVPPVTTATLLSHFATKGVFRPFTAYGTAQKLYEHGVTSYPRTREEIITRAGLDIAETLLAKSDPRRTVQIEPGLPVGGHESIRPAEPFLEPELRGLTGGEKEVYSYICNQFMDAAACKKVCMISGTIEMAGDLFDTEIESDNPDVEKILRVGSAAYGKVVPAHPSIRLQDLFTWMDRERIGTPGTYSSAVKSLVDKGYLSSGILVTNMGLKILEWVDKNASWLSATTSSNLEKLLDDVQMGKIGALKVFEALKDFSKEESIPVVQKDPMAALSDTVKVCFSPAPGL